MESTKTFSTRGNAKRNALKAGVPAEKIEIIAHGKGDDVRFAWCKAGTKPTTTVLKAKVPAKRAGPITRNGVKRPGAGGVCARVWDWLDQHSGATAKDVRAWAESEELNLNNATIEFYQYRKFHAKTA